MSPFYRRTFSFSCRCRPKTMHFCPDGEWTKGNDTNEIYFFLSRPFNEPSRGIMKSPEEGNFPIIFISRLLPSSFITQWFCISLRLFISTSTKSKKDSERKRRKKAKKTTRPIILSHIFLPSCLHFSALPILITIR